MSCEKMKDLLLTFKILQKELKSDNVFWHPYLCKVIINPAHNCDA